MQWVHQILYLNYKIFVLPHPSMLQILVYLLANERINNSDWIKENTLTKNHSASWFRNDFTPKKMVSCRELPEHAKFQNTFCTFQKVFFWHLSTNYPFFHDFAVVVYQNISKSKIAHKNNKNSAVGIFHWYDLPLGWRKLWFHRLRLPVLHHV